MRASGNASRLIALAADPRRVVRGVLHRFRIRWPRLAAHLTFDLPPRDISGSYSEVSPWDRQIPNVVFQTWVTPKLGRRHAKAVANFRAMNNDFSFRFFAENDMDEYMSTHFAGRPILEAYQRALFGPLRTDIWRYCVLWREGGVYCDIGKAIKVPLRTLIPNEAQGVLSYGLTVTQGSDSYLLPGEPNPADRAINWALMFAPGSEVMAAIISYIEDHLEVVLGRPFPDPKQAILEFTGPIALTRVVDSLSPTQKAGLLVAPMDFGRSGVQELPGAFVRYIEKPAYSLARDSVIVR